MFLSLRLPTTWRRKNNFIYKYNQEINTFSDSFILQMSGSTMNVQTMIDRMHGMHHGHIDANPFFANALQTCADSRKYIYSVIIIHILS